MNSLEKIYSRICLGLFILFVLLGTVFKTNVSHGYLTAFYFIIVLIVFGYMNFLRNVKCPKCVMKNRVFRQKEKKLICRSCKHEIQVETVTLDNYS